MIIEACVETLDQARRAEQNGATQLELCSELYHGGLTPGLGLVRKVTEHLNIPVKVMIRPRPGNFVYTEPEISRMLETIDLMKQEGVGGLVFGVLTPSHEVDTEQTRVLVKACGDLPVTFHRAVDITPDPLTATRQIACSGASFILTSGQAETALEGYETINRMAENSYPELSIIAAGGITASNLANLQKVCTVQAFHGTKIV